MTASPRSRLALAKYHGLGNDFLVLAGVTGASEEAAGLARRLCDRHRGVGADGLLLSGPGTVVDGVATDATMTLYNADGSLAEMSGNGIRCFAHDLVRRGGLAGGTLRITTGGGLRTVDLPSADFSAAGADGVLWCTVDMGVARPGPVADPTAPAPPTVVLKERTTDLGNPHVVLLVERPDAVELAVEGPQWERRFAQGANVHFVALADGEADSLTLRVWERGAGITEACGTGACAAAAAAHEWGLVGPHVTVHMPGGDVQVELADTVRLTGPSEWIADLEVPA